MREVRLAQTAEIEKKTVVNIAANMRARIFQACQKAIKTQKLEALGFLHRPREGLIVRAPFGHPYQLNIGLGDLGQRLVAEIGRCGRIFAGDRRAIGCGLDRGFDRRL